GERAGRDIIRDDRTRCKPSIVANFDGSIERIVDTRPDVAPDPRPGLRLARLVLVVRGDVPGGDVRVLPDLGVSDVREVGDLRARAHRRLLHLDEGADLRALTHAGSRPDVREGADLRPGCDLDLAADDGERV